MTAPERSGPQRAPAQDRPSYRDDHDFEPVHGLPEHLPPGERILWQGTPDWRVLAVETFHVRKVALYFGLLLLWRGASASADGMPADQALLHTLTMLPLALLGLGLLATLAWLTARTSVYTLTNQRVALRIGIVLSVTYNLPYPRIAAAALRRRGPGHGDIVLKLMPGERIAYLHLWPHARPWHLAPTEPMLRALPDADRVATLLAAALATSAGQARPPVSEPTGPAARPRGAPLAA